MECGFDNGSEFKSLFIDLCENFGLKPKRTTDYNPQSNVIIERVHAVLGNSFRTFELEKRELDEDNPFEEFLTATAYAIRSSQQFYYPIFYFNNASYGTGACGGT